MIRHRDYWVRNPRDASGNQAIAALEQHLRAHSAACTLLSQFDMTQFHLTLFTHYRQTAFRNRKEYHAMWYALRAAFPVVLACTLMPDHLHLAIECEDVHEALLKLATVGRAFAREFHRSRIWAPVRTRESIPNQQHLLRVIRYIHLNPARRGLVADPLEWEWCTHLDAVGAAAPTWLDLRTLQRAVEGVLTRSTLPWRERFHKYVSGDPSVKIDSTAYPRALDTLVAPELAIARAVIIASRAPNLGKTRRPSARRVFVQMALRVGRPSHITLAQFLGVSVRGVQFLASEELTATERAQLQAAWLGLSDRRIGNFAKTTVEVG